MKRLFACLLLCLCTLAHAQFDHSRAAWNNLLKEHGQWLPDNQQSRVDYAGFRRDRVPLRAVLDAMSAVPRATFDAWPREQRMAFLINAHNAHNAFTVEKLEDVFAKYAAQLSDKPEDRAKLRDEVLPVMHLDYDWSLNAAGR